VQANPTRGKALRRQHAVSTAGGRQPLECDREPQFIHELLQGGIPIARQQRKGAGKAEQGPGAAPVAEGGQFLHDATKDVIPLFDGFTIVGKEIAQIGNLLLMRTLLFPGEDTPPGFGEAIDPCRFAGQKGHSFRKAQHMQRFHEDTAGITAADGLHGDIAAVSPGSVGAGVAAAAPVFFHQGGGAAGLGQQGGTGEAGHAATDNDDVEALLPAGHGDRSIRMAAAVPPRPQLRASSVSQVVCPARATAMAIPPPSPDSPTMGLTARVCGG
jgi:hypothetical protein